VSTQTKRKNYLFLEEEKKKEENKKKITKDAS